MKHLIKKKLMRDRRRRRIRGRLSGTADRPRLAIHRTLLQIYAQLVDDAKGVTLCSASSLDLAKKGSLGDAKGGAISGAKAVGAEIARRAKESGRQKPTRMSTSRSIAWRAAKSSAKRPSVSSDV